MDTREYKTQGFDCQSPASFLYHCDMTAYMINYLYDIAAYIGTVLYLSTNQQLEMLQAQVVVGSQWGKNLLMHDGLAI